jgi:flagellar motor switch protein FliM
LDCHSVIICGEVMADKVLSQAEVDALLRGVSGGTIQTESEPHKTAGLRQYDLTGQERIVRGRMPTLEIINDRFCHHLQASFSSLIRKNIECSPLSIEITKYGEFIKKTPFPSSLSILKMEPLRGNIILALEARLIFILLDYYLGGTGQTHVKTEGRDFSKFEQRFIHQIVTLFIHDLQKAWEPLMPVSISLVRNETNPQFAMIVNPTEITVTAKFKIEIENQSWDILLSFPYPAIEPVREKLYGGFQSDQLAADPEWGNRFKMELQGCKVSVTAEIGSAVLSLEEVAQLAVGDIILLDRAVNEEIPLQVEDRVKFYGRPGISNGNNALVISRAIS